MLQDQTFSILFQHGVDSGSDPKTVIPTKATRVENLEFYGSNTLRQRPGSSAVTLTALSGNTPAVLKRIWSAGGEVMVESDAGLHASNLRRTVPKNVVPSEVVEVVAGARTFERGGLSWSPSTSVNAQPYAIDACLAQSSNVECVVWEEPTDIGSCTRTAQYRLIDRTTGTTLAGSSLNPLYTQDIKNPRVVPMPASEAPAGSEGWYIYYAAANAGGSLFELYRVVLTITTSTKVPSSLSAPVAVSTPHGIGSEGVFDIWPGPAEGFDGYAYAVVDQRSPARMDFGVLDLDGVTGFWSDDSATETDIRAVSVNMRFDLTSNLVASVAYADGGDVYTREAGFFTGTSITAYNTFSLGNECVGVQLCKNGFGADGSGLTVFAEDSYNPGPGLRGGVMWKPFDTGADSCAGETRGVALAGRPVPSESKIYVPLRMLSSLQPTWFLGLVTENSDVGLYGPRVVAKYPGAWNAFESIAGVRLPNAVGTATVAFPGLRDGSRPSEQGTIRGGTLIGLFEYDSAANLGSVPGLDGQVYLPGAQPSTYDGVKAVEAGFNYYPEGDSSSASNGAGSLSPSGTYQVRFVYEWTDFSGRRKQSAPSVAVSVAMGASDDTITCEVPFLFLTEMFDRQGAEQVRIIPYRTELNGTIFYRDLAYVSGLPTYVLNEFFFAASTVTTTSFELRQADSTLRASELLYTTGDALENDAFFPFAACVAHQGRLFSVDAVDPRTVRYTDETTSDLRYALATSSAVYQFQAPAEMGDVVALASMDDKLVLIGKERIGVIFGEGPNRLGADNRLSRVQLVTGALGGLEGYQQAVAVTPEGVWFMSNKGGMRLLGRDGNLAMDQDSGGFYGIDSDGMFPGPPSNVVAVSAPGRTEVRFYTPSNDCPTYDYQRGQWGKVTQSAVAGACEVRGGYIHATSSALFGQSSTGTDAGTPFTMLVETGWINPGQLQGFQRLREVMVLAQAMSGSPTITIDVGYDYEPTYAESVTFTASPSNNTSQPRLRVARQKCEAVRFRFSCSVGSVEGFRLTGFSAKVAVKKGLYKRSNSRAGE